jgi:hypothetical protein
VLEERTSAVMAAFSSLVFCLRHLGAVALQAAAIGLAGLLLVALWAGLDSLWPTTGYKTQIVTLLLAEALMLGRIGLRLALQGSQIALVRRARLAEGPLPPPSEAQ